MTGVDLTRIDGVDAYTARKFISEIGADLTKWPRANRAAAALRLAANALHRSDRANVGRSAGVVRRSFPYKVSFGEFHANDSSLNGLQVRIIWQIALASPDGAYGEVCLRSV